MNNELQDLLQTLPPGNRMDEFKHNNDDPDRACYYHACLRYVSHDPMSNASLRQRLGIEEQNYSIASRIIADALKANFIKPRDPENTSKKHARYVPFWA